MDLRLRKDNVFKNALSAKPGTKSKSSMDDLIECPVCMTYMFPPIHQCCNGHTICFKCKSRVNNICPICRKELGNIRCLALEKVAERLDLPCKFHVFGCQCIFLTIKYSSTRRSVDFAHIIVLTILTVRSREISSP